MNNKNYKEKYKYLSYKKIFPVISRKNNYRKNYKSWIKNKVNS